MTKAKRDFMCERYIRGVLIFAGMDGEFWSVRSLTGFGVRLV